MKTKFLGSAGRFRQGLERLSRGLRQWAGDRRGAIAIQFAFLVVPLTILGFGLVDLNRMNTQKYNLQDSLDAAALYAARSDATTNAELQAAGQKALNANLNLMHGAELISSSFVLDADGVGVTADAEMKMPAVVSNLWTNQDLKVKAHSEVMRNTKNIEVALVLDVTGSMRDQPIIDLRAAATELIDIVVKDQQAPFYSKVSIVPYSMGVNVGDYADDVRGAIPAAKGITNATWKGTTSKAISTTTRQNWVVVNASNHGFSNGNWVYIEDVAGGMSGLNNKGYKVANKTTNSFQLEGVDGSSGYSSDGAGGKATLCTYSNCDTLITAASHGFATNARVRITDIVGPTNLNDTTYQVTRVSSSQFRLNGSGAGDKPYSSGGDAWCTTYGCEFYYFTNPNGAGRTHRISTCVSERIGSDKYTDNHPVGLNYPAPSNPCLSNTIYPLSADKTALKAQITALKEEGSTAGHIGVAWGWYMISPNFGSLWPNAVNKPAAYNAPNTLKVVVWMTDGANNTAYCNGVIAQDSGNGSGLTSDHINCNATNGSSSTQTLALCSAMKANGIVVYSVGFNIAGNQSAIDVVNGCATDLRHVYLPSGGAALSEAFSAIGAEIDNLRLTR